MSSNGRPFLGYSNWYWLVKDRNIALAFDTEVVVSAAAEEEVLVFSEEEVVDSIPLKLVIPESSVVVKQEPEVVSDKKDMGMGVDYGHERQKEKAY